MLVEWICLFNNNNDVNDDNGCTCGNSVSLMFVRWDMLLDINETKFTSHPVGVEIERGVIAARGCRSRGRQ